MQIIGLEHSFAVVTWGTQGVASAVRPGSDQFIAEAGAKLPFGRLLDPVEIARSVVSLTSPGSGILTGSIGDYDQSIAGRSDSGPQPNGRVPDPDVSEKTQRLRGNK
jgi:hypothetical protein